MTEVTHAEIISTTPRGRFLTSQERQFVVNYASGMPVREAAKSVGLDARDGLKLMERQDIAETVGILRQKLTQELGAVITRDFVGAMILEAHKKAATATEEITAARELAKLYGLNAPEKQLVVSYNVQRVEQLEALSDQELARIADLGDVVNKPALPALDEGDTEC